MKKLIILISFLLTQNYSHAQSPGWEVDPQAFSSSMVMVGVINVNEGESTDEEDLIAAFVGDEIRGIASPVFDENIGRSIAYMIVYGEVNGEDVTFQIYDKSANEIIEAAKVVSYEVNGIVGTVNLPYIWSDKILTSAKEIQFINVFPNPTSEVLSLSFEDAYRGELMLSITDLQGKIMNTTGFQKGEFSFSGQVDVTGLPRGVYLLTLRENGELTYSGRFVKQ